MGVQKNNIPLYGSNKVGSSLNQLVDSGQDGGYFEFTDVPMVSANGGVDTAVAVHMYDNGLKMFVQNIGTQTAGTAQPAGSAYGVDYSYDGADDEGVQWCLATPAGIGYTSGPRIQKYTVGSDAFYAKLRFRIDDVSDTDDCLFGFRKVEAFQAAVDNYDEMAAWNIVSGDIKTETVINNATTVTTDITSGGGDAAGNWADEGIHSLEVKVSSAGAVTYAIDGETPSSAVAFSFDAGEVVTPFGYHLHAAASAMGLHLISFEHGRQ